MTTLIPSLTIPCLGGLRPLDDTPDGLFVLDQTLLPHQVAFRTLKSVSELITAIQALVVRGAPLIGIAGAYGACLSAKTHLHLALPDFTERLTADIAAIREARPTAVNLMWAMDRMKNRLQALLTQPQETNPTEILAALQAEAQQIAEEDAQMCLAMGRHGAELVPTGARILTHCNAGALATGGIGTALGVIRTAFAADPSIQVYADETRPRFQGAKLTVWELQQDGIPVTLLADNMAAWAMQQGMIDVVLVGADRIARNGDSANKIGTYGLALAAKAHDIPFYVVAPSSTIDAALETGAGIPIEQRHADEVRCVDGVSVTPSATAVYNPAFDVTPAHLITGIITEQGRFSSPYHLA